jgi:transposase
MAMEVVNDDAKGGFRRIEVLIGPARWRRWSAAEKGRIVAETLEVGATVTAVARRWQLCPHQVWGWRREARAGDLALPSAAPAPREPTFVAIVAEPASTSAAAAMTTPTSERRRTAASIEIKLAGAVARVACGTEGALLTAVLRAVRASAA